MINARALLVSNDAQTGRVWLDSLGQMGLNTVVVNTVEEALACCFRESFDVTVIDVDSPQLDGLKLCRCLRRYMTQLILLLSYNGETPYTLEAFQAGADIYLVKPLSPALFRARVAALLRRLQRAPVEEFGVDQR